MVGSNAARLFLRGIKAMSIMRYEPAYRPLRLVNRLHSDLDRLFDFGIQDAQEAVTDWLPAVDISEEEDRFVLTADLPGVSPDDIEITMENGVLTLQGERSSEHTDEQKGYRRTERVVGKFHRRFSLPETADDNSVSARNRNGVLELVIPKQEKPKARRISVRSD